MAELKTYKQKVRVILEQYERARNNDGVLMAHYINTYHPGLVSIDQDGDVTIKLKNFTSLPPLENIRRSRQIIQNDDGEFPPTDPKVVKARRIKEKNWNDCEVREAKAPRLTHSDN